MVQPKRKRKPSISRHPLFPAIVGLWGAALFALVALALPTTLLESLVLAGHVDRLIPAAAPPLGTNARLLVALLSGLIGGCAAWALARYSAGRKPRPTPQVLNVADVDPDQTLAWPGAIDKEAAPAADDDQALDPPVDGYAPQAEADRPAALEPQPEVRPPTAAERIAGAPLDALSRVELIERLAIGLNRRQQLLEASPVEGPAPIGPVVRFPGLSERRQSPRSGPSAVAPKPVPQETEKALRDALATLQRMSGGS